MPNAARPASYLDPYLAAANQHGSGFESLLWASPATQAMRFNALAQLCDFRNLNILDAGCGRADFLDFLVAQKMPPAHYAGIEAIATLADAARQKRHPNCLILNADFVHEPARFLVGADAIVFCGSLNTLSTKDFYATLATAFEATADWLIFNFLCSPKLAQADWLTWHLPGHVRSFAEKLTSRISIACEYLEGDYTIALRKEPE